MISANGGEPVTDGPHTRRQEAQDRSEPAAIDGTPRSGAPRFGSDSSSPAVQLLLDLFNEAGDPAEEL